MSPSPRGFDAYCRKAEQGGTVERICVALDVGLEMHDAFDARRPDGPTRLAIVLPALRTWITQKAALAPKTQWGLVVLRDAAAELLLAPTERDIMLATLNSVAQPRPRDAFEEDDGVADAPFDFSSLYSVLGDAFGTARPDGAVDRCLVVFGRSRAVPVATGEFALRRAGGAFFLDAIYVHEKAAPPVRDVQAVYDALGILSEKGLIRRIQPAGSSARYEDRVGDNHHHLICRSCGETVDVDCALGAAPCLTAADDTGYEIDEAEVIYWGRCPACQKTN